MEKCIDAGTIQAFLDGELAQNAAAKVAGHIAACDVCAFSLAEAEEETAFAFAALEQEFNTLVPTNRLWTKINDSIEQNKTASIRQTIFANFKFLFANPSIAAFAGLLIVAGIFAVLWNARTADDTEKYTAAQNEGNKQIDVAQPKTIESTVSANANDSEKSTFATLKNPSSTSQASGFQVVKTDFIKKGNIKKENRQPLKQLSPDTGTPKIVATEYVSGEETYLKTIATLEKTVDSRKDELLKPSARFSYEKDLAIVNNAIVTMKTQVKKNPKNEAARQVLLSSYQNKVDLLSSVADKNDLMASLR